MPDVKSGIFSALREQEIVCDDTVGLKYPGNSPECSTGSTGRQAKCRRKGQADLTCSCIWKACMVCTAFGCPGSREMSGWLLCLASRDSISTGA